MYIFEIIAKILASWKNKKKYYQKIDFEEDKDICEHIYLVIDSSKDYLACNKCGHVIKNPTKYN
ncbi:MAG: hypothetical protein V2B14_05845 [bacterium]